MNDLDNKYYLNNSHHKTMLSCGPRHIASVDIGMVGNVLGGISSSNFHNLATGTTIHHIFRDYIDSKKRWYNCWSNTLKIGNYKFKKYSNKESSSNLKIYDKDTICGHLSNIHMDHRFISWFTQHYDFSGLGEIEEEVYAAARAYYVSLMKICIERFHKQCNPNVNRHYYNPEVCARNIAFCYWSCLTMVNAIDHKGFDNLRNTSYQYSTYYVNKFEDIVNEKNGTNYTYSRLYYNEDMDKLEQDGNVAMVRAAFGLK